jgi:DNA-binding GntR family transcriptional regulator
MKTNEYRSTAAIRDLKKTLKDRFEINEEEAVNFVKGLEEENIELIIYNYNFLFSEMEKELFDRQYNNILKFLNRDSADVADIEQIIETSKITSFVKPYYLSLKTYLPNELCDEYIYDQYKILSEEFATKRIVPDKLKQIIALEVNYLNSELKQQLKFCKAGK